MFPIHFLIASIRSEQVLIALNDHRFLYMLTEPFAKLVLFIPSTISFWNSLPLHVVAPPSKSFAWVIIIMSKYIFLFGHQPH